MAEVMQRGSQGLVTTSSSRRWSSWCCMVGNTVKSWSLFWWRGTACSSPGHDQPAQPRLAGTVARHKEEAGSRPGWSWAWPVMGRSRPGSESWSSSSHVRRRGCRCGCGMPATSQWPAWHGSGRLGCGRIGPAAGCDVLGRGLGRQGLDGMELSAGWLWWRGRVLLLLAIAAVVAGCNLQRGGGGMALHGEELEEGRQVAVAIGRSKESGSG